MDRGSHEQLEVDLMQFVVAMIQIEFVRRLNRREVIYYNREINYKETYRVCKTPKP